MAQPMALELYYAIIRYVDNTYDLLSLALCCSVFRDEAQRCLFRFVGPKSERQHAQFISAINTSPLRLGPLIYSYCISEEVGSYKKEGDHESLCLALRSMCNLLHLKNDWCLPTTVLQGCTFRLRTLVWTGYMEKSDIHSLFYEFLPTQHSIKRLKLLSGDVHNVLEVPINLCPMLESFGGCNKNIIGTLLRDNRLIRRFEWLVVGDLPTLTTGQLNHLEYLVYSLERGIEAPFTHQLTSLVFLELYIYCPGSEHINLEQKLRFLQGLPCLKVLVLDSLCNSYTDYIPAYHLAFELRPTLEYIDVRDSGDFYHRVFPPSDGDDDILVSEMRVHEREVLGWRREYGIGPTWSEYV